MSSSSSSGAGSGSGSGAPKTLQIGQFTYTPSESTTEKNPASQIARRIGLSMYLNGSDPSKGVNTSGMAPLAPSSISTSTSFIQQMNSVIQRLENDWFTLYKKIRDEFRLPTNQELTELKRVKDAIYYTISQNPGTTSEWYEHFNAVLTGKGESEELIAKLKEMSGGRSYKKRRSVRKSKTSKKLKKSKKSRKSSH